MNPNPTLLGSSPAMVAVKKVKQKPRYWNEEEDALLREAIKKHGTEGYHTWKEVAKHVPNRSYRECMQRWTKVLAPGLKKGKWSAEEDQLLIELVTRQLETLGEGNGKRIVWNKVAQGFKGRSCKQCRERWINHLDPSVKKTEWTQEEDLSLLQLFETMPNKWAKIARQIPGRTENMVKVRWNALNRQAKKRKQNALYTPARGQMRNDYLPNMNGYLNPVNGIGSLPTPPGPQTQASYNQFYINNSISLSLNNNANLARQQNGNPPLPLTPGGRKSLTGAAPQGNIPNLAIDYSGDRRNSLYFFPNGQPEINNVQMNMNPFPHLPGVNQVQPVDQGLLQHREEHMRRMSIALSTLQQNQTPQALKLENQGAAAQKQGEQDPRSDSLCIKENFGDDIYKPESGLPRTGSIAQFSRLMNPLTPSTADITGDRRLSLITGFQFDEQAEGDSNLNMANQQGVGNGLPQQNGRRLSSLLYQDLMKNMHSANNAATPEGAQASQAQKRQRFMAEALSNADAAKVDK